MTLHMSDTCGGFSQFDSGGKLLTTDMSFEVAEDTYAQKNAGISRVGVSFAGICLMMDAFRLTACESQYVGLPS